jgi:uncharacterized protein (DUF427 family)
VVEEDGTEVMLENWCWMLRAPRAGARHIKEYYAFKNGKNMFNILS